MQTWFGPQTLPHPPQLVLSVALWTHALPHFVSPGAHAAAHLPWEQLGVRTVLAHETPQPPQLAGSSFCSTQIVLAPTAHCVNPGRQSHFPLTQ